MEIVERTYITLSGLASLVEGILDRDELRGVWVLCEVNSLNVNRGSGHCYMELVEKNGEGRGATVATFRAMVWSSRWRLIERMFQDQAGQELTVGMKILVNCSVTFHAVYGMALTINDIDPSYTVGEAQRQRAKTIAALKADGVFDMNRELELATVVQRVAVVSSATAAGYGDFLRQLSEAPYRIETTLFQAVMQGDGAERSVIEALEEIAAQDDNFDCVVIIRGGGATTDLQCFDSYLLCSAISQMPLPVLTGIGHDRDNSIADMVAYQNFKTPTALAAALVEIADEYYNQFYTIYIGVCDRVEKILMGETARTASLATGIASRAQSALNTQAARLSGLTTRIATSATTPLATRLSIVGTLRKTVLESSLTAIERARIRLAHLAEITAARNPRNILSLGYAMITTPDGRTLTEARNLKPGSEIIVETNTNILTTTVKHNVPKK